MTYIKNRDDLTLCFSVFVCLSVCLVMFLIHRGDHFPKKQPREAPYGDQSLVPTGADANFWQQVRCRVKV